MRAVLIGSAGPVLGREYPLDASVVTIGRRDENTIVIKDPTVSRNHAEIRQSGDDYVLVDKGSTSGITVNGTLIEGQHYLRDGDRIGIGGSAVFLTQLQPIEGKTITFSSSQLADGGRTQFISRDRLEDPRASVPSSTVPFMSPPMGRSGETQIDAAPLPSAPSPAPETFTPPPVLPPVRDAFPAASVSPPQVSPQPILPAAQEFGAAPRLPEAGATRDWPLPQTPAQAPPRFDAPLPDLAPPAFNQPGATPPPVFSASPFNQLEANQPASSAPPELPRFGGPDLSSPPAFGGGAPLPPLPPNPGTSFPGPPSGPPLGTLPPLGQPPQIGSMGGFSAPQAPQAMMTPPTPPAPAKSRTGLIVALVVLVVLILIALAVVALLFLRK